MSERIFISGPLTARGVGPHKAPQVMIHHVDNAIVIANTLIRKGHYIFLPHLSYYIHTSHSCYQDYGEYWYELDNTYLDNWATAMYFIGHSKGADKELIRAKNIGLKIYRKLSEVPEVYNKFILARDK